MYYEGDHMPKEAVLQVRINADMKQDAEKLFEQFDLTLTEAVRISIRQSVEMQCEKVFSFIKKLNKHLHSLY